MALSFGLVSQDALPPRVEALCFATDDLFADTSRGVGLNPDEYVLKHLMQKFGGHQQGMNEGSPASHSSASEQVDAPPTQHQSAHPTPTSPTTHQVPATTLALSRLATSCPSTAIGPKIEDIDNDCAAQLLSWAPQGHTIQDPVEEASAIGVLPTFGNTHCGNFMTRSSLGSLDFSGSDDAASTGKMMTSDSLMTAWTMDSLPAVRTLEYLPHVK